MNLFHPKKQTLVISGLSYENLRWVPVLMDSYNVKLIQDIEQLWDTFVNPASLPSLILLGPQATLVERELIRQFKLNPQTGSIPIVLLGWSRCEANELLGSDQVNLDVIELPMPSALIVEKILRRLAPNPQRIAVTDACRAQHL